MANTKLDLQLVETYKLGTIAFADISRYIPNANNPSFEITVPGYSKINVPFTPSIVNIYNAVNLEISNDSDENTYLPDGIYNIKYSVAPNNVYFIERSFMRTSYIDSLYKRTFLQIDNGCDCNPSIKKELKEELRDIKLLIDGSVAAADNCDISMANRLYRKAFEMIKNMKLCECG